MASRLGPGGIRGTATPAFRRAAATYDQKTLGRLSYSSRVIQAGVYETLLAAAHDAMAMVLPAPGGPVTEVSLPRAPFSMSLSMRGRVIAQPGRPGMVILDIRTGSPSACLGPRAAPRTWVLGIPVPSPVWPAPVDGDPAASYLSAMP